MVSAAITLNLLEDVISMVYDRENADTEICNKQSY